MMTGYLEMMKKGYVLYRRISLETGKVVGHFWDPRNEHERRGEQYERYGWKIEPLSPAETIEHFQEQQQTMAA